MQPLPARATIHRMIGMRRGAVVAVAVAVAATLAGAPARADEPPCQQFLPKYAGGSPRVDELTVDGHRVIVFKPRSYDSSTRRYPVLYLLHGGLSTPDEWLERMDLEALAADLELLVVMPEGGSGGFYTDWRHDPDGLNQWESFHIGRLVPFIDATYRTIPDRAQRAVAGLSMGGFGAMRYAARHPDLFVAAGSFLGLLDSNETVMLRILEQTAPVVSPCFEGRVENLNDRWGPRATDEVWWRDSNPTDLAPNLHGVRIFTRVGTGKPCDSEDLVDTAESDFTALTMEPDAQRQTESFRRALDREGIPHDSVTNDCGIHTWRHGARGLREFLPWLLPQYGGKAPASFSYRSAAARFEVWGWSFVAAPERTPEFLDVHRASRRGLTLTGTGRTEITTAPLFAPRQHVKVTGAQEHVQVLRAGADRRLRLEVDLGPANEVQQYSTHGGLLRRAPVTREIRLQTRASRSRHGSQRRSG